MNIEESLKKFVREEVLDNSVEIDVDDNLLADGMVDSLGMLRVVTHIEELLNIKIPHEDLLIENFGTIKVIAGYIRRRTTDNNVKEN